MDLCYGPRARRYTRECTYSRCAFLRDDPTRDYDSLGRKPFNNHVSNLRFVTTQENLDNRERLWVTARVGDSVMTSLTQIAHAVDRKSVRGVRAR